MVFNKRIGSHRCLRTRNNARIHTPVSIRPYLYACRQTPIPGSAEPVTSVVEVPAPPAGKGLVGERGCHVNRHKLTEG